MSADIAAADSMTIAAARLLRGGAVCFVGIGLPSKAANLARATHAPELVLVYEAGAIGAKPTILPLSIGDGELAATADAVVSTPEIFRYWLQGGRIDMGLLGAAQIDRFANINTTVIGPYDKPKVRLPGAGGAPEIAAHARDLLIILRQSTRTFVSKLDFVTSIGFGEGGDSRKRLGMPGRGPLAVVSDLGVLRPDPITRELVLVELAPGVTVEKVVASTGWPLRVAENVAPMKPPTDTELLALHRLEESSRAKHGHEETGAA